MFGLEIFWWWQYVADLFSLALAACLAIYGLILTQWPPPKTTQRWFTVGAALLASGVVFWNTAVYAIPPHPRMSVSLFMIMLTWTTLKYRARVQARSEVQHRRAEDE